MINYRHAHMHDGPKDDCDNDPGDAPRRQRPRIAEHAEQTFVRVPRHYGSEGDERRRKDGGATLIDRSLLDGDRN